MPPIPEPASIDTALVGLNRLATAARLLSGAAHEVNNALQVIAGTVEILELRPDMPPAASNALERLRSQVARAAGALGRVTDFTRLPRGVSGPVNVRELVTDALALREFAIRRAHLSARIETDPATTYVVSGNRGDLQQVLLNLIINAEQALAGTTGAIVVRLSGDEGQVLIRIRTEGGKPIAVDPARAFDAFVTGGDPFETAGLGLWVGRLLVEAHGGSLTLEDGEGVTFVMTLSRS